jgi:hypothetical protein
MLLALLMLVAGLVGGALGGPADGGPLPLEAFLCIRGGPARPLASGSGVELSICLASTLEAGRGIGGALPALIGIGGLEPAVGILVPAPGGPLAERGGPLGGGGVAEAAGVAEPLSFLLIQRFNSGS